MNACPSFPLASAGPDVRQEHLRSGLLAIRGTPGMGFSEHLENIRIGLGTSGPRPAALGESSGLRVFSRISPQASGEHKEST